MRGKRRANKNHGENVRNIPAYAGKTCAKRSKCWFSTEHPRVCGENQNAIPIVTERTGTSPRMRGKPGCWHKPIPPEGNIPAYAGKTLIDVRFLVPEGHFTFDFVFLHRGGFHGIPPAAPSFLSVLVSESSFTASSGPACFRLTAALFGGTVDNF